MFIVYYIIHTTQERHLGTESQNQELKWPGKLRLFYVEKKNFNERINILKTQNSTTSMPLVFYPLISWSQKQLFSLNRVLTC